MKIEMKKTLFIYCNSYEILYFVKNGDFSKYHNTVMDCGKNSEKSNFLMDLIYDDDGGYKEKMLTELPLDLIQQNHDISIVHVILNDI